MALLSIKRVNNFRVLRLEPGIKELPNKCHLKFPITAPLLNHISSPSDTGSISRGPLSHSSKV